MRRSIHTTTVALVAAASLAAVPAALARPAVDVVGSHPAATADLTPAQLHAINGHQPVDPAPVTSGDLALPPAAPADTGGGSSVPWTIIALPFGVLLATGAARKASHRTVLPHRAPRISI
ncbi:MAG: hypothetical protein QOE86_4666 [Solirubrobacteraceae bacterium]|nr:hypothetical protein [Solirubrobacteraceae bacterium]